MSLKTAVIALLIDGLTGMTIISAIRHYTMRRERSKWTLRIVHSLAVITAWLGSIIAFVIGDLERHRNKTVLDVISGNYFIYLAISVVSLSLLIVVLLAIPRESK